METGEHHMPVKRKAGKLAREAIATEASAKMESVDANVKRTKTSGVRELDGAEPHRTVTVPGIVAEVTAEPDAERLPVRNANGELVFPGFPGFRPNLTPQQIIKAGAFGGTYFRPITSGVTGQSYVDAHKEFSWFDDVSTSMMTRSWTKYDTTINYFDVDCGGSLEMWESSGWICNLDPYGWFQWYCRFYLGRRSTDDSRQISRWEKFAGPKGRFRNQLIGNCARANTSFDDVSISPVIRQSLLHWGKLLTEAEATTYVKLKQLSGLQRSSAKSID